MKTLVIFATTVLLTLSTALSAHTGIKSTEPTNQQTLDSAPEKLSLTFRAPVRLMKVSLKDVEKTDLDLGFKPSAKANKSFHIELPELPVGEYFVKWVSMGKDGHKITGNFSFDIVEKSIEAGVSSE